MAKPSNNPTKPAPKTDQDAPEPNLDPTKNQSGDGTAESDNPTPGNSTESAAPIAETLATQPPADPSWRASVSLFDLVVDAVVTLDPLIEAVSREIEDYGLPVGLENVQAQVVSLEPVIKRYIDLAFFKKLDLKTVMVVVADPSKDYTLRTLNFLRELQGLPETFFYPEYWDEAPEVPDAE